MALSPASSHGGTGSPFNMATVTLTDAQIKALPTTAVQAIAAPGAGQVLVPVACMMHLTWAADYANIGSTAQLGLSWGATLTSTVVPLGEPLTAEVSNLLADGASHVAFLPPIAVAAGASATVSGIGQITDDPGPINAALTIYAANTGTHTGDFTGGDAGNSLKVTVYYATFAI